jgi:outer membrane receptor for ferrienterochelin and colicin
MAQTPRAIDDIEHPEHLRDLLDDEQFREELEELVRTARERIRAAPNPLAALTAEEIRRSRASDLPEIIGISPRRKPRG